MNECLFQVYILHWSWHLATPFWRGTETQLCNKHEVRKIMLRSDSQGFSSPSKRCAEFIAIIVWCTETNEGKKRKRRKKSFSYLLSNLWPSSTVHPWCPPPNVSIKRVNQGVFAWVYTQVCEDLDSLYHKQSPLWHIALSILDSNPLSTHITKLLVGYFPIPVLVGVENGLVNYFLQLFLCQVAAHHCLQHLKQLSIADKTILVYVIYSKGNYKIKKM